VTPAANAHAVTTTLGIDLASQPQNTALCAIAWAPDHAEIVALLKGVDNGGTPLNDELLIAAMCGLWGGVAAPSKVAIDAPIGWPVDFVQAVSGSAPWPVGIDGDRRRLERRATDHWVHGVASKLPLSVTTDRIAYAAMRAAGVLAHFEATFNQTVDRSGMTGLVCETYPDPAIRRLGLWPATARARDSYKRSAVELRESIMQGLRRAAPWLKLSTAHYEACLDSDDCLDALVCAVVARATELGLSDAPPSDLEQEAQAEGWIHLPVATFQFDTLLR
jgi:hypothetical protein